jgi:hypothetical protein
MAIYTTQLRSIVEQCQADYHAGPDDFTCAYARLGLADYPIFDESYRQTLNDKIIRHYYFCEIGDETVARFRWHLRTTMFEQMPYFNQLYQSLNLITDPLTNVHYTYSEAIAENVSVEGSESRTGTVNRDVDVTETHTGDDVTEAAKGTTTTEELEHGHTVTDSLQHGKTETETLQHGHVVDDSQVTNYGRTQATVNGGSDQTLDGKTSEREIKSDTPMNQITAGGVEGLNYATEVTYTDREGTRAGTTTYGGTTNVTYGGADSTTDRTVNSGTDTTTTGTTGTDTSTTTNAGTDTTTTTTDGADTTTLTHGEVVTIVTNDDTATSTTGTDTRATDRDLTRDHERMGYDGISQSRLLEEFRKTFLNVDLRVIESVGRCFFGLWM